MPVIPGSVIVNTGGTLMHLSEGRYSATLHRVNTTLIPGRDPRFNALLPLPKMDGDLVPFGRQERLASAAGYEQDRDRGANAAVNRMGTFPQVTRRWWVEEYAELRDQQQRSRGRDHSGLRTRCQARQTLFRGEASLDERLYMSVSPMLLIACSVPLARLGHELSKLSMVARSVRASLAGTPSASCQNSSQKEFWSQVPFQTSHERDPGSYEVFLGAR